MIKTERLTINGKIFIRIYSTSNRYVVRDGVEYSEAYDPEDTGRTYEEGGVMVEEDGNYTEAGRILMGKDPAEALL